MGIAKVSNILRMAKDYLLPIEERMMFDWLVVKQEDFGIEKPFRHSVKQVQDATGLTKHQQNKAIDHFVKIGFLQIGVDFFQNNPYRTYYVDFQILKGLNVLEQIIRVGTDTFKEFHKWITELAIAQTKKEKPLSRNQIKQQEKEEKKAKEDTERLYTMMCAKWNERVNMYNNGELTTNIPQRTKEHNQLPIGANGKKLLQNLNKKYNADTIIHGWTVYADMCMKEEIKPKNIMLYFLAKEDGEFKVADSMINKYALSYGYKNWRTEY